MRSAFGSTRVSGLTDAYVCRRRAPRSSQRPAQNRPGQDAGGVERGLEPAVHLQRGDRRLAETAGTADHGAILRLRDARPERREAAAVREPDPGDPDPHQGPPVVRPAEDGVEPDGATATSATTGAVTASGPRPRPLVDLDVTDSLADPRRLLLDLLGPPLQRDLDPSASPRRRRERDGMEQRPAGLQTARRRHHEPPRLREGRTFTATWTIAPSVPRDPVASRWRS